MLSNPQQDMTLSYITAAELVRMQPSGKLAIIDVRDEERSYDGHIAGSWHFASDTFDEKLPGLVEKLKGQQAVIFHCAKSQVRGPTCARKLVEYMSASSCNIGIDNVPKIYVLERGFNGWAGAGHPVCQCSQTDCKGC